MAPGNMWRIRPKGSRTLKICLRPASNHAVAIIRGDAAPTASGPVPDAKSPDGFCTSWEIRDRVGRATCTATSAPLAGAALCSHFTRSGPGHRDLR